MNSTLSIEMIPKIATQSEMWAFKNDPKVEFHAISSI